MGSFSRVEKYVDDRAVYELYGSGELQISRLFWNRRFDQAQVAFLNCIQQLSDYAQQKDATFRLPYRYAKCTLLFNEYSSRINKDKIGEVSIKNQFGQDELWTKALKYMLTNLKWLLAFCCGSRSLE